MSYRVIHVAGQVWTYTVGRGVTSLRGPNGEKEVVNNFKLVGLSPHAFERGQWKRTVDGMVRPRHVARFIEGLARR